VVVPGRLPLFSNVEDGRWVVPARTILVDSTQLESGDAMSGEFKKLAAREIDEFKADYMRRFPGRDAENLTDEDLMREVMNSVGKPGKLGENVRCVVSVSMLTEGWDANTVTHILGVRAFGTQLLAEQVVGRGLRRTSYMLDEDTDHFTPEYAEVYGVPFSFIPAAGSRKDPPPRRPTTRVRALEERNDCEITFPVVVGYRWELPDDHLEGDFDEDSRLPLSSQNVPTTTDVAGIVGEIEVHTLDDLKAIRPQQIAFAVGKRLLDRYFRDAPDPEGVAVERPWLYPRLVQITKQWMDDPNGLVLRDNAFPQLLGLSQNAEQAVDLIYRGIVHSAGAERRLKPILRAWDPVGTTGNVDFDTTKRVFPTSPTKCQVSHVTADSGWEERMAQALEELPEVVHFVKNQSLGFAIPYSVDGRQHTYLPDFIVDLDDGHGPDDLLHLVVEVTGQRDRAKAAKVATARELWVPAVNNHGGFGRWAVVEVIDPWDAHATLREATQHAMAGAPV
jgi:type III restriction enzyme